MRWIFGSNGIAGPEGLGNANLEMFKGAPLKALAREICQNSLDACRDKANPVRIEFILHEISTSKFPGISELKNIIDKCETYWEKDGNKKTKAFFRDAKRALSGDKLKILRISDYNTKGLLGSDDKDNVFTAWTGLITGSSMSVKEDENAGGSYGIGKNAPFVNSYIQTVFYRTFAEDDTRAAQGVAHLASFIDDTYPEGDRLRRSLGFFANNDGSPLKSISELDSICVRTEYGTDLFIPAFKIEDDWVNKMSAEIMDNFLMSIYNGRLEVRIGAYGAENREIAKNTMNQTLSLCDKYIKEAKGFVEVLRANEEEIEVSERSFWGMGKLKLTLLFGRKNLNQKILVVRSSGMKIAEIPRLPRQISFAGILELVGDEINAYFRGMETPQHDKWEPKRHPDDPDEARAKKSDLEKWVVQIIENKALENAGDTDEIDTSDFFNASHENGEMDTDDAEEGNSLKEKSVSYEFSGAQSKKRLYDSSGKNGNKLEKGFVDPDGNEIGHRHRTGSKGGDATGRKALINPLGPDSVYAESRRVGYKARVVKDSKGFEKLFIASDESINDALVEIASIGENGKPVPIDVASAESIGANVYCKNGKIYIDKLEAGKKITIQLQLVEEQNFALGVTVYGNKE